MTITTSCHKDVLICTDVNYDVAFKMEKGKKYCFPDGNFFIADELGNAFCPCAGECVWEGEMILKHHGEESGTTFSKETGSSIRTDSHIMSEGFTAIFSDIDVASCPSLEIFSAMVVVHKE